ncbi:MAG: hypothetical protein V7603_5102 [Micromonosporaceae bacterium]
MYESGTPAMRARHMPAPIGEAEQVLHEHRRDGAGRCATCGTPATCPYAAEATRLRQHYREWLNGAVKRAQDDDPLLVRPYVRPMDDDDGRDLLPRLPHSGDVVWLGAEARGVVRGHGRDRVAGDPGVRLADL